jgi:DNA-binding NarL/FixJ family response regulator
MSRIRVLLADDHTLLLDGLRRLLETEFELVGTVTNGRDLLTAADELQPDVILLDISMPFLNGIDAARQLRQRENKARLVFLTMHKDPNYVKEAFRAGASGYVLKHAAGTELVGALREVMRDHFYLSPLVSKATLTELLGPKSERGGRPSGELTARQREVLRLVAEGNAGKVIANILNISQKTVEFHKASIMRQLGLHSTAELTRYAVTHGIVDETIE